MCVVIWANMYRDGLAGDESFIVRREYEHPGDSPCSVVDGGSQLLANEWLLSATVWAENVLLNGVSADTRRYSAGIIGALCRLLLAWNELRNPTSCWVELEADDNKAELFDTETNFNTNVNLYGT